MVVVLPAPLTPTIRMTWGRPGVGSCTGASQGRRISRNSVFRAAINSSSVPSPELRAAARSRVMTRAVASTPTSAVSSRVSSSSNTASSTRRPPPSRPLSPAPSCPRVRARPSFRREKSPRGGASVGVAVWGVSGRFLPKPNICGLPGISGGDRRTDTGRVMLAKGPGARPAGRRAAAGRWRRREGCLSRQHLSRRGRIDRLARGATLGVTPKPRRLTP